MTLFRVLPTQLTTISHSFYVDEALTDMASPPTVTVRRLDGTVVQGPSAATPVSTGVYSFAVAAQGQLDTLTVDWVGTLAGASHTAQDILEVVGGHLFGLAQARNALKLDLRSYSTAELAAKRISVEIECEDIRRQAQVPRFMRVALDGSGTSQLVTPHLEVRRVRAVSLSYGDGSAPVALTAGELALIAPNRAGVLTRTSGEVWPYGHGNILVEYEHGLSYPIQTVQDAAILRLRYFLNATRTAVPDRALSFSVAEGGTYRLAAAGPRSTGIPDVDAAYLRDAHERVWIA